MLIFYFWLTQMKISQLYITDNKASFAEKKPLQLNFT